MTTIAIDKTGTIAADGLVTGTYITGEHYEKVFEVEEGYLCFAGSCQQWIRFLYWWKNKNGEDFDCKDLPDMTKCWCLLLDRNGECFSHEAEKGQTPIGVKETLPCAIGSGYAYAMGAMDAGADSVQAVKIAAKRDIKTNSNVKEYRL